MESQEKVLKIRNTHKEKFRFARQSVEITGHSQIYLYKSLALREEFDNFTKCEPFDIEYKPDPFKYQYDLEFFIFLNYENLRKREIELSPEVIHPFIAEYGPTGFAREEHLLNAMAIRWPTKIMPTGEYLGVMVRNPWLEDFCFAVSNYRDVITFGGGGQGKTYGFLAFMCLLFDHFIHTKQGAQCSFSTVSETKLKHSTWAYVNKIYPISERRNPFSLYAGLGKRAPDYTFRRVNLLGRYIEEGGNFIGILLPKGIKDARVIDKLTGCHDPIARCYLLDEAQSTDGAPLNAYTNMFLHPKHGWFGMSGNYETDGDLLGINVEPNKGWEEINAATHIYEGTLKSPTSNLGRTTCVIHYNNDLSPAMLDLEANRKFPFLPNLSKKDELYPTEESRHTYEYKRFWVGFRYEKENTVGFNILTQKLLDEFNCSEKPNFGDQVITVGSFDSAPASKDRNIFLVAQIGLDKDTQYPIVAPSKVITFPKAETHLTYYTETCDSFEKVMGEYNIGKQGKTIMDWSAKPALIEMLAQRKILCNFIIYHGILPNKPTENPVNRVVEDKMPLETIKTFVGSLEKETTTYAHEKLKNRIALGAYVMRQFIEKGRVKNFSSSLLNGVTKHNGFEKEFLRRKFVTNDKGIINLCDKDDFIAANHFSPDILDCFNQLFYMVFWIFGIKPDVKSLGKLIGEDKNKDRLGKIKNIFDLRIKF